MIIDRKGKPQYRVEGSVPLRYGSWLVMSCLALLITGCSCTRDYAYVVVLDTSQISGGEKNGAVITYAIDGATGQLKEISTVATEQGPHSITIDPSGKHAYVANIDSTSVTQYAIGDNGKLTRSNTAYCRKTDPSTDPYCSAPISVTITPSGQYAYVANVGGPTITKLTIGAKGELTNTSTFTIDFLTDSIAIDPSGKHAYAANRDNCTIAHICSVSQYNIEEGGVFKPMNPATVETGFTPYSITVDHLGQYAYVTNNGSSTITQYTIKDGALTSPFNISTTGAGYPTNPITLAISPSGKYAYVPMAYGKPSSGVLQYKIDDDGKLSPNPAEGSNRVDAGYVPDSIAIDPSGKYAYVANQEDASISLYKIGDHGELSPIDPPFIQVGNPARNQKAASVATVRKNHWWHIW